MYGMQTYENFSEFQNDYPEVAAQLLEEVDEGGWMNEEIYYYFSLEDYAEYELTEGVYIDLGLDRMDFRGAPNPMDYIDLKALGNALWNSWDDSVTWSNGDCVVSTSYGW